MTIITEKSTYVLEVKSKYTYRVFVNGAGSISVEVQLTKAFKNVSLRDYCLISVSNERFDKLSVNDINRLFLVARKAISEYGTYGELDEADFRIHWDE